MIHLLDERRGQALYSADHATDSSEFGGGARRGDHADTLAGGNEGARKGHGKAVAQGGYRLHWGNVLVDRHRLAGQNRLVDPQVPRLDHAQVGRNPVAGLENYDVTGDQMFRAYGHALASPNHRSAGVDHAANGLERLLSASLLDIADYGIDDDDGQDYQGVHDVFDGRCKRSGDQQYVDQEIVELDQEAHQRAAAAALG